MSSFIIQDYFDLFPIATVKGQHHFGISESGRIRNITFIEGDNDSLRLIRFDTDKLLVVDSGNILTADVREICHGAIISLMWSIRSVFVLSASYSIVYAPQIFS